MSRACALTFGLLVVTALASTAAAQPAPPDVNGTEYLCMKDAADAGAKFLYARTKCVIRCVKHVWRGDGLDADCHPPYGGKTAECLVRAETKFVKKFVKGCDQTLDPDDDCPECYSGGDCSASGDAASRASSLEADSDAFLEGLLCERAGASRLEQKCQQVTAKAVAKLFGVRMDCYERCFNITRDGNPPMSDCLPPPAHLPTDACLTSVALKYLEDIDERCAGPSEAPDGCSGGYPSAPAWDNLSAIWVAGNVIPTYCSE